MRDARDRTVFHGDSWVPDEVPPGTRCKHGWGDCSLCGTSEARDVIHTARTPNKREAARLRRRGKKP